jgi:hypothetical protein
VGYGPLQIGRLVALINGIERLVIFFVGWAVIILMTTQNWAV